ncbi:MAG: hypothetical protein ABR964_15635 [Tepidisphaeraceae bacterium]|jgi:hypothetical protein
MSEYQYVAFRAIDAPVSEKNLKFMRQQSSRAEITPLSFENEYHFGDFHGDALEMLRRGYDFHFHYADFGVRKLMIRLPNGLPDPAAAEPYLEQDSLHFLKDKQGGGGILCLEPYLEPGELDDLWELDGFLDRLLPLRAEILDGDLRPLYLAHLAVASDRNHDPDKEKDAPVPAGLNKLTDAQRALTKLYGLSEALIAAAARNSPPPPKRTDSDRHYATWLQHQPEATKIEWLHQLMADPRAAVRSEILAEYQKSQTTPSWPTIRLDRTIAEIRTAAEAIQHEQNRKHAEAAARRRAKKLAEMAADPTRTLRETEELVEERSLETYHQIALLLADLREALSSTDQSSLAEQHARKLKDKNPTLHHLTAELRGQGFLKK